MPIDEMLISDAEFSLGELKGLVDSYHYRHGTIGRELYDDSVRCIANFIDEVRKEIKNAD